MKRGPTTHETRGNGINDIFISRVGPCLENRLLELPGENRLPFRHSRRAYNAARTTGLIHLQKKKKKKKKKT